MKWLPMLALLTLACSGNETTKETKQSATVKAVKVENTQTANPKRITTVKQNTEKPNSKAAKAHIGDTRYVIHFPSSKDGRKTNVLVRPLGDFKMNLEYPASLNLDKTEAPKNLAGQRQAPTELTEAQLHFVMPISEEAPSSNGTKLKAVIDFSVCNAQACEMIEKEITWKVKSGS